MRVRLIVAGAVVVGMGMCQWVDAQGNNWFQANGMGRPVNIMTPGSLYKNRVPPSVGNAGTLNTANQYGNRSSSTVPQSSAITQPLVKPSPFASPFQTQPPMGAQPNTTITPQTSAFASPFTPLKSASPTTPQPTGLGMGQQPPLQQPPAYSSALPSTPLTTPLQQPIYPIAPQFSTVAPTPYGGQPGGLLATPVKTPAYGAGQQALPAGTPQSGLSSMPAQQPLLMTTPQPTAQPTQPQGQSPYMPSSSAPLSVPLMTPMGTSLSTPLQQSLSMPQTQPLFPQPAAQH